MKNKLSKEERKAKELEDYKKLLRTLIRRSITANFNIELPGSILKSGQRQIIEQILQDKYEKALEQIMFEEDKLMFRRMQMATSTKKKKQTKPESKPISEPPPTGIKEQEPKNVTNNNINNSIVTCKIWDDDAMETVQTVAKALLNLTELFKAQNIKIESLVKMDGNGMSTVRNSNFAASGIDDPFKK